MTMFNRSHPKLGDIGHRLEGIFHDRLIARLLATAHEWRARRTMARELRLLSDVDLRDIGLTKADIEAACADSADRSAARALRKAAQDRAGNW